MNSGASGEVGDAYLHLLVDYISLLNLSADAQSFHLQEVVPGTQKAKTRYHKPSSTIKFLIISPKSAATHCCATLT